LFVLKLTISVWLRWRIARLRTSPRTWVLFETRLSWMFPNASAHRWPQYLKKNLNRFFYFINFRSNREIKSYTIHNSFWGIGLVEHRYCLYERCCLICSAYQRRALCLPLVLLYPINCFFVGLIRKLNRV
jgi:hypothetical protein